MKQLDMDQMEDLMDDMADIMADQEEINEMMGQNFAVEFDENDLLDELAELDEMAVTE
jgi:charged multivesicular body protein 5